MKNAIDDYDPASLSPLSTAPSSFVSGKDLVHGKFRLTTGIPDNRSDLPKNIVFIPAAAEEKVTKSKVKIPLTDTVRKEWGLGSANMILKLCAGKRHPKSLVNSLLSETAGYDDWKKDAILQVKRKQKLIKKRIWKPRIKATNPSVQGQVSSSGYGKKHGGKDHVRDLGMAHATPTTSLSRSATPMSARPSFSRSSSLPSFTSPSSRTHSGSLPADSPAFRTKKSFGEEFDPEETKIVQGMNNYEKFRIDESGFSSGDSSSSHSSDGLDTDSSENSDTAREKKKKHALAASAASQKLDDACDDVSSDSSEGDFMPNTEKRQVIHNTKDKNNVESILSNMLFERLVNIYVTIIEASAKANNWILIDRIADDHSPTAELLLEYALTRTQSTPNIIVVDSLARFKSGKGSWATDQHKALEDLFTNIKKKSSENKNNDVESVPALSNFSHFKDWRDFVGDDDLPFEPTEKEKQFGIPSDPEHPYASYQVHGKKRWSFYYRSTLFASGTHYVIVGEKGYNFNRAGLGSTGYIFANGGNAEYYQLKKCIREGRPSILLMNTGSVTQAFCSLRAGLRWKKIKKDTDHYRLTNPQLDSAIQGALQVLQHEDYWAYKFGLSEIDLCNDVLSRSPLLFDSYIISADIISMSQEDVLNTVSQVFSDGGKSGIPELGVGNAEDLVVYNAWQRHVVLFENSVSYRFDANKLYMMLVITAFLTTLTSVIYSNLKGDFDPVPRQELLDSSCPTYDPENAGADTACDKLYVHLTEAEDLEAFGKALNIFVIVLPIIAGFLGTVLSRYALEARWKMAYMRSMQIASEIFVYRSKVGRYKDVSREELQRAKKEGRGAMEDERPHFVRRVQHIFTNALSGEIGTSGSLSFSDSYEPSALFSTSTNNKEEEVYSHIDKYLYENFAGKEKQRRKEKLLAEKRNSSKDKKWMKKQSKVTKTGFSSFLPFGNKKESTNEEAMENAAVITGKKKVKSMDTLLSVLVSEGGSQGKVSSKRKHLVFKEEIKEIMYGSSGKKGLEKSRKVGDGEVKEEDKDTCFNLMSIDEYFSHRIVPLVRLYEYKAPLLSSKLTTLEIVSFIFTSFGALLAVINLAHWVAITVAIAASLESYISHSGLRQQRDILNKNIKEIQNMLTWWDSLTIVERRQLQNREKAVMTTEECFIAYAEKVSGFQRVTELEMERGQGSRQTGDSKNANSGKNQDKGGADSGDEADDEGD
ncbi:hypothetical protein TrVE_jg12256 [Triparma verrucosa]|uniref:SMODS and SLOG-associating 2TM effector domain-containing protein n=1 Tax=Triparma verrucosa TaxID=1606542 RepID=A0A9W7F8Y6_9STRA|nr:hypothetical protein TrVE_jg12256 [Triparma verrucosa]